MTDLLPCPFCGKIPEIDEFNYGFFDYARINCCNLFFEWCGENVRENIIKAWNRRAQTEITGETSDGYHTFNELYHHRAVLFSVICNDRPALAWKSKLHHDGTMYDGMFIVGIETPEGQATYHYDVNPYWVMFRVPELPQAPEWDGHTPAQAIERIGKLAQPENEPLTLEDGFDITNADGGPIDYDALGQKYKDQLCYCDIDGFYIGEDGQLVLMDDCGSAVWVDRGDYHVEIRKPERSEGKDG